MYNVKLKDLQELNEEVVENLPEGYLLIVKLGNLELEKHQNIVIEKPVVAPISMENMTKVEYLIAKASEYIGTRYRGGGTTSAGFDCSGLIFTTFKYRHDLAAILRINGSRGRSKNRKRTGSKRGFDFFYDQWKRKYQSRWDDY
jgi:hypothetical protein